MRRCSQAIALQTFLCLVACTIACSTDDDCYPHGACCCDPLLGICRSCPIGDSPTSSSISTKFSGDLICRNAIYAIATFDSYKAEENGWNLAASGGYCSTLLADKPLAWRKNYGLIAFCSPHGQEACGKCLNVTNVVSGAHQMVRVVDNKCNNNKGELDLDSAVFQNLDAYGEGKIQGHLVVKYQFVDCKD